MVETSYTPERGHFIRLRFDPQAGHEQMGTRPALVVSHTRFNRRMSLAFVCPISNTQRRNSFYVQIPNGENITGVIMADQLRSLDYRARRAEFIGECSDSLLKEVLRRIRPILF
ncbi:MAG: type II toxin-antitoxin system PemK/MazF family toxin [Chroococcidiopsidaceae cyanobacterium CP_BM_RX_35]|nr:type II toxin-antitoxin system PemK/MazF family toxin [Chroococcidiopsidaceae cyanobacterium CP_BM_RX_35]